MNLLIDYSALVQKKEFLQCKVTVIFIIHRMNNGQRGDILKSLASSSSVIT